MDCPICHTSRFDRLYGLLNGAILSCGNCTTVFQENLVTEEAARELYEEESYLDSPLLETLKVGARTDVEPYLVYGQVLERLDGMVPPGRLLDVGCSYGAFLEMAKQRGWRVQGVELSEKSGAYAAEKRDLEIFTGTLEQACYPDEHFSVITLWDLIEHLECPVDTLKEIRRILVPGGIVVIFTLNQRSLINRTGDFLYRASWGSFTKPLELLYHPIHNFFFSPKTLTYALHEAGFAGEIEVGWMDANVDRWHVVPISAPLVFGTRCLDIASHWIGQQYRMIFFASA